MDFKYQDKLTMQNVLISSYYKNTFIDFFIENPFNFKKLIEFNNFIEKKLLNYNFNHWNDFLEFKKIYNCINFLKNYFVIIRDEKNIEIDFNEVEYIELYDSLIKKYYFDISYGYKLEKLLKLNLDENQKKIIEVFLTRNFNKLKINQNQLKKLKNNIILHSEKLMNINSNIDTMIDKCILIKKTDDITGLSEEIKKIGLSNAFHYKKNGYLFFPDELTTSNLLRNLTNRSLRRKIYNNFYNLGNYNLNEVSEDDLHLRNLILEKQKVAKIMNKKNYADLVFSNFILKDSNEVYNYLIKVEKEIKPKIDYIHNKIKELALKDNIKYIKPWDFIYYHAKLINEFYDKFEKEKKELRFKKYFNFNTVINNLIIFFKNNLNINIDIKDLNCNKFFKNSITLVLYDKKTKRKAYWIISPNLNEQDLWYASSLAKMDFYNENPTSNVQFIKLQIDNLKEMSFNELSSLMHEFGHALVDFYSCKFNDITDNNQMTLDLLELPSQFLEEFIYNYDFVKKLSNHNKTNNKISEKLFNDIVEINQKNIYIYIYQEIKKYKAQILIHEKYNYNIKQNPNSFIYHKFKNNGIIYNINKDLFMFLNRDQVEVDYGPAKFVYLYSGLISFKIYDLYINKNNDNLKNIFENVLTTKSKLLSNHLQNIKELNINNLEIEKYIKKNNKIKILGDI